MINLVLGSMGCIGSSLVKELRKSSDNAVYEVGRQPINSYEQFQEHPNYLCCNLSGTENFQELLRYIETIKNIEGKNVDAIYNCSGSISENLNYLINNNVLSTVNLLDVVFALGINPSIVLIGSSAEYGKSGVCVETDICNSNYPTSFYAMSKLNQTLIAKHYAKKHGMNIKIARPSNIFSIKARNINTIVGKVFSNDFEKGKLKLGNMSAMRDYIHVNDLVNALMCISAQGASGEIYNVGSFDTVIVRNVVKYIMKVRGLDYDSLIEENADQSHGTDSSCLNNMKLKSLGWKCGNSELQNYYIKTV